MYKLQTLALIVALFALKTIEAQNSPSIISTIPSTQTWYTCSKSLSDRIDYNVTLLDGKQQTVNDIGKIDPGYPVHAPAGASPGFITIVANETVLKNYLDPTFNGEFTYKVDASCYETKPLVPVKTCSKAILLDDPDIYCLAITNPMDQTITFRLDLKFKEFPSNTKPNTTAAQTSSKSSTPTSPTSTPTQTAGVKMLVVDLIPIVAGFLISYFAVYAL